MEFKMQDSILLYCHTTLFKLSGICLGVPIINKIQPKTEQIFTQVEVTI